MSDHEHHWGREVQAGLAPLARELRAEIPGVIQAFGDLHKAAMSAGALDVKTKVASFAGVVPVGPEVMVVSGGVVSTVKVLVFESAEMTPMAFVEVARTVCELADNAVGGVKLQVPEAVAVADIWKNQSNIQIIFSTLVKKIDK